MSAAVGGTIDERTHYEVLGLSEDATTEEIRAAWRSLISEVHPDRESDQSAKEEANHRAALINNAYTTLKDRVSRDRYDAGLLRERGAAESYEGADEHAEQGAPYDYPEDYLSEEEEEDLWERIQQETEAEAEEAWQRWENPPLSDRLSDAFAELREYDFSGANFRGAGLDLQRARREFARANPGKSLLWNVPMLTTIMAALTFGELLFAGAVFIYPAYVLITAIGAALGIDLLLAVLGARPMRLLATRSGGPAEFSEGAKLAAASALSLRAVWAGTVGGLLVGGALTTVGGALAWLFSSPVLFYVLPPVFLLLPITWTVVVLAIWATRSLASTRITEDEDTERE